MSEIGSGRIIRQARQGIAKGASYPLSKSLANAEVRDRAIISAVTGSGEGDTSPSLQQLARLLARQAARSHYRGRGYSNPFIGVLLLLMALLIAAAMVFGPHLMPGH